MTFKVLNAETNKAILRSNVRPTDNNNMNLRAEPLTSSEIVKSLHIHPIPSKNASSADESDSASVPKHTMPIIDPRNLVGRTFLIDKEEGQRLAVKIVQAINDQKGNLARNSTRMKFLCTIKDGTIEEIFICNELLDHINNSTEDDIIEWKFKKISACEGPLPQSYPNCNSFPCNLRIEWENGEITSEPLSIIATNDSLSCAIYVRDNDLLDKPGWKRFKSLAKRDKKLLRLLKQAKMRS